VARVLVAYASKHGSTAEIAESIASALREKGHEVELTDAGEVGGLDQIDAVVLGSAVYMKRWRREAKRFLRKHGDRLAEIPFWVFSSGPVGEDSEQEMDSDWVEPPRIIERIEGLGARDHVAFGGRLPDEPGGLMERAMVKGTPEEFRDRRDWDRIREWGEEVASELSAGGNPGAQPEQR
jgi:menaquinone-dependent protoporphyrinogen oxidase